MYTMEILKQLDRLEFDFFDHTSYSTIPFYFYHYHKKFLYIHIGAPIYICHVPVVSASASRRTF